MEFKPDFYEFTPADDPFNNASFAVKREYNPEAFDELSQWMDDRNFDKFKRILVPLPVKYPFKGGTGVVNLEKNATWNPTGIAVEITEQSTSGALFVVPRTFKYILREGRDDEEEGAAAKDYVIEALQKQLRETQAYIKRHPEHREEIEEKLVKVVEELEKEEKEEEEFNPEAAMRWMRKSEALGMYDLADLYQVYHELEEVRRKMRAHLYDEIILEGLRVREEMLEDQAREMEDVLMRRKQLTEEAEKEKKKRMKKRLQEEEEEEEEQGRELEVATQEQTHRKFTLRRQPRVDYSGSGSKRQKEEPEDTPLVKATRRPKPKTPMMMKTTQKPTSPQEGAEPSDAMMIGFGIQLLKFTAIASQMENGRQLIADLLNKCDDCGNIGCHLCCGRCKKRYYCNVECQKRGWKKSHSKNCCATATTSCC